MIRIKDILPLIDDSQKIEMFRIIGNDAGYYIGKAKNVPEEYMNLIVDYISAGKGDCPQYATKNNILLLDCYDDIAYKKKTW